MEAQLPINKSILGEDGQLIVIGAGGKVGTQLYLPKLIELGVPQERIVAVEPDDVRRNAVGEQFPHVQLVEETEIALSSVRGKAQPNRGIIIASSTAAHATNFEAIANAACRGWLDPTQTAIWSEKPVADPSEFPRVEALVARHGLSVSVGYILRYSGAIQALTRYLAEKDLSLTGLRWQYGKDRTRDIRPSQGVLADELVHPLSVTSLLLRNAEGIEPAPNVRTAGLQRRPFVNMQAQLAARERNPSMPLSPISDVYVELDYPGVPVAISSSFLFEEEIRRATIGARNPIGKAQELKLSFDERRTDADGNGRRVDVFTGPDGVRYEWSGDKARLQMVHFLGLVASNRVRAGATFATELMLQRTLSDIAAYKEKPPTQV